MKRRDFNAWVSEVVMNVIVLGVHHGTEKRARKLHDFQGVGFKISQILPQTGMCAQQW